MGRTDATEVTAFTDGCPGLRAILANTGVTKSPILDWFHIAMRLQHTKLAAAKLSTNDPGRVKAKATIVAEVERLHWRIWNGKAKNAQRSINRIRKVMHVFKGGTARARGAWRRASCGTRCMRSINTSAAKPHGWSTMPNDTVPACALERQSPRAQRTSWSTGAWCCSRTQIGGDPASHVGRWQRVPLGQAGRGVHGLEHDRRGSSFRLKGRSRVVPVGTMDEVISLRVRNRRQRCLQVAGQIETPRPPDPILRRPCADREEKRETHGRDMRNKNSLPPATPDRKGVRKGRAWLNANSTALRYSNGEQSHAERLQTDG